MSSSDHWACQRERAKRQGSHRTTLEASPIGIDLGLSVDELLDINCSRCGTPLKVRIADLGDARFVECEACAAKRPFSRRQVFVAFDRNRPDVTPSD